MNKSEPYVTLGDCQGLIQNGRLLAGREQEGQKRANKSITRNIALQGGLDVPPKTFLSRIAFNPFYEKVETVGEEQPPIQLDWEESIDTHQVLRLP